MPAAPRARATRRDAAGAVTGLLDITWSGRRCSAVPIWILQSFRRANQVPLVNVAGVVAILLSMIPVCIATRISSGVATVR
jgi:hypothetical protein